MASDSNLEFRVSRLENDRDSIYDLITEITATQREHSQRFDRIETTLTERFEQIDRRFEQIDRRFEQIDRRFEQIEGRFEQIEGRFEQIEDRLDALAVTLTEVVRRLPDPS